MKKTILVFIVGSTILMLMSPLVSSIGYITIEKNSTGFDKEILIEEISKRIDLIYLQKINLKNPLLNVDPDGPFEGGLDDSSDWYDLLFGSLYGLLLFQYIKNKMLKDAFESGNVYYSIKMLLNYLQMSTECLFSLIDAFDIADSDNNGY
jgi:hypothetical protein